MSKRENLRSRVKTAKERCDLPVLPCYPQQYMHRWNISCAFLRRCKKASQGMRRCARSQLQMSKNRGLDDEIDDQSTATCAETYPWRIIIRAFARALIATSRLFAVRQFRTFMTFRFAASIYAVCYTRIENSSCARRRKGSKKGESERIRESEQSPGEVYV